MFQSGCTRVLRRGIGFFGMLTLAGGTILGAPDPVGLWEFDNPGDVLQATVGAPLVLKGGHTPIPGITEGDGAVRIGVGSYYECRHEIASEGSEFVNRFTLLFDFRILRILPWYCFFQTDVGNRNDGDCFIRANDGAFGVGQTGYSATRAQPWVWQRLLVAVDNPAGLYRLYLDGELILEGSPQAVDGRFSLDPTLLLFADENGEDAPIDVTRVGIFDRALTAMEALELGSPFSGDPDNLPPEMVAASAGPDIAGTGEATAYSFTAVDPEGDTVQVRVSWGDGDVSGWSGLVPSGEPVTMTHIYRQAGEYLLRAVARDAQGRIGTWLELQSVVVEGEPLVQILTQPYLQNLKTDGITILWECDLAAVASVEYGLNSTPDQSQPATATDSGFGTHIYRATLTDLWPGTTYQYQLTVAGRGETRGSFSTAPSGAPPFAFGVWADSQGHNHGAYPADPLEPTKSMMQHMAASGVAFGVGVGDLAENGASYSDTRQYYLDRVARYLGEAVPWFVAWGNHDAGRGAVLRQFAVMPSEERSGFEAGYGSFSFDYAGCHFVCIDYATATSDIRNWLESDLQSLANQNARFTFVFVHVPPYCELWIDGDTFLRNELVPLLEAYGVDACFSGHTHEYSRGYLNGVYYCITGGGSWLDLPELLVRDWDHMTVGGFHQIPGVPDYGVTRGGGLINEYVRVEVTSDGFTASMIAFEPDGTPLGVLDTFMSTSEQGPLKITAIRRTEDGVDLEWEGPAGPYQIQFQPQLAVGPWIDLGSPVSAGERTVRLTPEHGTGWYRLRLAR